MFKWNRQIDSTGGQTFLSVERKTSLSEVGQTFLSVTRPRVRAYSPAEGTRNSEGLAQVRTDSEGEYASTRRSAADKNVYPPSMRKGFTLVELMISVALALLLIVGINKVFQISSQTVGAGQALSTISRDDRTAHTIIYADLQNAVTNTPNANSSPAFYIASSNIYAFRNAADQQSNNNSTQPQTLNDGTTVDATAVNDRSHRQDVLGFLAQGNTYTRQTANDGQYVSPTTSSQAFIVYGHVMIPNNAALKTATPLSDANPPFPPGGPSSPGQVNDNNFFASDWILGRVAMLMVPSPSPATPDVYIQPGATTGNPFGWDAMSSDNVYHIYYSRYDIVNTILSGTTASFLSLEQAAAAGPTVFRDQMIWYNPTEPITIPPTSTATYNILRYAANPFAAKPLSSSAVATATPIFIRSCAHFIVEFAGDYLTQDPTTGAEVIDQATNTPIYAPDNTIDFVVDSVTGQKKVRWYGFPRDTNGDGRIDLNDVVPLRDLRPTPPTPFVSCERALGFAQSANYAGQGAALSYQQYVCSWGPETSDPLPKMIRITIALDDPNGRLASPQFFEYVIDLTK